MKKIQIHQATIAYVAVVVCSIICQKSKIGQFIYFPYLGTILWKSQHLR